MLRESIIPWVRRWHPAGTQLVTDEHGFLADFGRDEIVPPPNPECRTLLELAERSSVLILCGSPGSGKTTEIELLREELTEEHAPCLFYRAAALGTGSTLSQLTVGHHLWQSAKSNDTQLTLIVDGIDEALAREETIVEQLLAVIASDPLSKLRIVLSCRTADWQTSAQESLRDRFALGESRFVYHLCPLRRRDLIQAAESKSIDPGAFFRALVKHDAVSLARFPITLVMLLKEFPASKSLDATRLEFYQRFIRSSLRELNPNRAKAAQSKLSEDHKLQIARRLAAMTMFGSKFGIVNEPRNTPAPGLLTFSEALGPDPTEKRPQGDTFEITPDSLDDVLRTNLFSCSEFEGETVFAFSHRTYAELLAAEYIRELPPHEIQRLMSIRSLGTEKIPPQLVEVAAWLTNTLDDQGEFFEFLCSKDPEALLRADLSLLNDKQKERLLSILVEKAKQGNPAPERAISNAAASLKFPGMETLLNPLIVDPDAQIFSRRFAFDLVRICRLQESESSLWKVLKNPDDPARRAVTWPLQELLRDHPEHRQDELEQLARGEFGPDPDDDLKGMALQLLVPKLWTVSEALAHLTPVQNRQLLGNYWVLLHHKLPEAMKPEDLPDLLEFLKHNKEGFDPLSSIEELAKATLDLAADHLEDPSIRTALAEMWMEKARNFHSLPGSRRGAIVNLKSHHQKRRSLLKTALNLPTTQRENVHLSGRLIEKDDFPWLLEQLPSVSKDRLPVWCLAVVRWATLSAREQHLDLLQDRYENFSELRDEFPPIQTGETIHEALQRTEAEAQQKQDAWDAELAAASESEERPTWRDLFQVGCDQVTNGHISGWVNMSNAFDWHTSGITETQVYYSRDIGLWSDLDTEDQKLMKDTARRFLLELDDSAHSIQSKTDYSEAAYFAIRLLTKESGLDDELLSAIKDKWIGALVDCIDSNEEGHGEVLKLAFDLNPTETRRWFRILLDRTQKGDGDGFLFGLAAFASIWNTDFTASLSTFLLETEPKPQSIRDAVEFLAKNDPDGAEQLAIRMIETAPDLKSPAARATIAAGLSYLPSKLWKRFWPIVLSSSTDDITNMWTENIRIHDRGDRRLPSSFTENQLVDLHLLLRKVFPPQDDPRLESGSVSRQQMCIDLRNGCREELVRRGASDNIQRIIDAVPAEDQAWERWHLLDAEQTRQTREWHPVEIDDLVRLTHSRDARFIRDANDLMDVLVSTLEDWEHDLQTQHVERLWSWNRENGKKTDFHPKEEETLSKELEDWLKRKLKNLVNVNREVQIDRLNHRVDLKVEATPRHDPENRLTVIIEVKRAHHPDLASSIEKQLVADYLRSNPGWNNGIYLVGWYNCDVWDKTATKVRLKTKTLKGARSELKRNAENVSQLSEKAVVAVVVDCRITSK